MSKSEIIQFVDGKLKLLDVNVDLEKDTAWLTLEQMSIGFDRDFSVIGKHIRNIFKEKELNEVTSRQILPGSTEENRSSMIYNLDVIILEAYSECIK